MYACQCSLSQTVSLAVGRKLTCMHVYVQAASVQVLGHDDISQLSATHLVDAVQVTSCIFVRPCKGK